MAQLNQVYILSETQKKCISQCYQQKKVPFLMGEEFRELIENAFGSILINPTNSDFICDLVTNLVKKIEIVASHTRLNIEVELYSVLESCLKEEMELVKGKDDLIIDLRDTWAAISTNSYNLKEIERLKNDEQFRASVKMIEELKKYIHPGWAQCMNVSSKEGTTATWAQCLVGLQNSVLKGILAWNNGQREKATGKGEELSFERLQKWCEIMAEILWMALDQMIWAEYITQYGNHCGHYYLESPAFASLKRQISGLLDNLLKGTLIVEQQPQQILASTSKFPQSIVIRHLCAHKIIRLADLSSAQLHLIGRTVVNELAPENKEIVPIAQITKSRKEFSSTDNTGAFTCTFSGCKIQNFSREANSTLLVTEEKIYMYFETQLSYTGRELKAWTLSLPIVIASHGSQNTNAMGTIFWHNFFATNLYFSQVPSSVPLDNLIEALNQFFLLKTGTILTEENKNVLERKLARRDTREVCWTDFWRDNMAGHRFSFWAWFYEIILLIENFFPNIWIEQRDFISGFIERREAEEKLEGCSKGTFILRYSDSYLGTITISHVNRDGIPESSNPMNKNDLTDLKDSSINKHTLANKIMGLNDLQFIYPHTPKDEVFKKYTMIPRSKPGYSMISESNPSVNNEVNMIETSMTNENENAVEMTIPAVEMAIPAIEMGPVPSFGINQNSSSESDDSFESYLDLSDSEIEYINEMWNAEKILCSQ